MQHSDWFAMCCSLHLHDTGHVLLFVMFFRVFLLSDTFQLFCLTLGLFIKNLRCLLTRFTQRKHAAIENQ